MLDSCDPIDAGADDLAPKTAESTPAEAVPPEDKANAADVAQAAGGKDAAEAQTDLMLAIAMVVQQPAPEGKEAAPVEGAADEVVADEAQSEADQSLQQAVASGETDASAAAQPAPLPAAVPVPAAIPTAGEATVAAPNAAESIPAASAVTGAKAATSPAAPAAEAADAKTATPAGQAEAALAASAGKENAQKSGQPLSTAETPPGDKAAAPVASTPATDAEAAAQKAANRSADAPAAAAPQREINTSDTKPIAAAPPSPEITANSAAVPAPVVTSAVAQHVAQPSAQQPGPKDAVPVAGLAVEIAAQAQAGKTHFEIRLDPPELGRIDVRLDVDSDGQVTSHLRVERPETLDLLRRDAPALERALQQAGLKTSDSGLQFSLRDQAFSQRDQGRDTPAMAHIVVPDEKLAPVETQRHYGRLTGLGSGVDIRV